MNCYRFEASEPGLRQRGNLTLWIEDAALEQWQVWKGRAGPLLGSGHSDEPDRAHGVQAAIVVDRGLDGVGHRIDGPGDFSAGSYGGQPSSGDATAGTREAGATRTIASLIGSIGLQVYGAGQWLEAKHGAKSRRTWRKLHLAVDAASCMIVAQTLIDQDVDDPSVTARSDRG